MNNHKKVSYPDQLLEEMQIEDTIFPNVKNSLGVVTLSQQVNSKHTLRIYQLIFNYKKDSYEVIQELTAFTFFSRKELKIFSENLPHLNGLEMLMLLHPLPQDNLLIN